MKIQVNGAPLFELTETQKKVIMDDILEDMFEQDMRRRLEWVLTHKYEQCFKALKHEWEPKFKERGIEMVPTNDEKFAELVFAQPDYKNKSMRMKEQKKR